MILPSLDDTLALAHFLESSAVETVVLLNISLPSGFISAGQIATSDLH